jgi:hypothetical protein
MKVKLYSEKNYNSILRELQPASYKICESTEPLIQTISPGLNNYPYPLLTVVMGTGSTLEAPLYYQGYIIPAGEEIIVQRVLRHCVHNGTPHLNADDNIIFPVQNGNILRVSRKDAPDHYMQIAKLGGLEDVAFAYHLPTEKMGPVNKYCENGATVPIEINCSSIAKEGFVYDITDGKK